MAQVGSLGADLRRVTLRGAGVALAIVLALPGCSGKVSNGAGHSRLGPDESSNPEGDAGDSPASPEGTGGSSSGPVGTPGGPVGPGGAQGVPPTKGGAGGAIGGGSNPSAGPEANTLCTADGYFDRTVLTEAAFRARIVGQWMSCGTTSVFGTSEAGLEITADGNWYKLVENAGQVVRATEPAAAGTYDVIDTSSMNGSGSFQLNLASGLGTVMVHPQFTNQPVKMAMNNMGVYEGLYVLPNQAFPPSLDETFAADFPPGDCSGVEPAPGYTESLSEFESWITGRWLSCGGSVFGSAGDPGDVGIDIAPDGTFHRLYLLPGTDAIVVVGHGFGREGTWSALDTSQMNGPGSFQLDFHIAGTGSVNSFPQAASSPRTLGLQNTMTADTSRYVIAP
jgi:hypothetical protein